MSTHLARVLPSFRLHPPPSLAHLTCRDALLGLLEETTGLHRVCGQVGVRSSGKQAGGAIRQDPRSFMRALQAFPSPGLPHSSNEREETQMGNPSGEAHDRPVSPTHGFLLEETTLCPVILGHLGSCQPEASKSAVAFPLWNHGIFTGKCKVPSHHMTPSTWSKEELHYSLGETPRRTQFYDPK